MALGPTRTGSHHARALRATVSPTAKLKSDLMSHVSVEGSSLALSSLLVSQKVASLSVVFGFLCWRLFVRFLQLVPYCRTSPGSFSSILVFFRLSYIFVVNLKSLVTSHLSPIVCLVFSSGRFPPQQLLCSLAKSTDFFDISTGRRK